MKDLIEENKLENDFEDLLKIGEWIDEHPNETKQVYDDKYDEMMKKGQEIYKKMQERNQNGQNQENQQNQGQTQENKKGPSIEEVD